MLGVFSNRYAKVTGLFTIIIPDAIVSKLIIHANITFVDFPNSASTSLFNSELKDKKIFFSKRKVYKLAESPRDHQYFSGRSDRFERYYMDSVGFGGSLTSEFIETKDMTFKKTIKLPKLEGANKLPTINLKAKFDIQKSLNINQNAEFISNSKVMKAQGDSDFLEK